MGWVKLGPALGTRRELPPGLGWDWHWVPGALSRTPTWGWKACCSHCHCCLQMKPVTQTRITPSSPASPLPANACAMLLAAKGNQDLAGNASCCPRVDLTQLSSGAVDSVLLNGGRWPPGTGACCVEMQRGVKLMCWCAHTYMTSCQLAVTAPTFPLPAGSPWAGEDRSGAPRDHWPPKDPA